MIAPTKNNKQTSPLEQVKNIEAKAASFGMSAIEFAALHNKPKVVDMLIKLKSAENNLNVNELKLAQQKTKNPEIIKSLGDRIKLEQGKGAKRKPLLEFLAEKKLFNLTKLVVSNRYRSGCLKSKDLDKPAKIAQKTGQRKLYEFLTLARVKLISSVFKNVEKTSTPIVASTNGVVNPKINKNSQNQR